MPLSCSVEYHGGIPEVIGDNEIVSLTGSSSILHLGGRKILIDLGLFQGGEGSDLYNKENIGFINDIDAVIITHTHVDHIGRLALLYKLGINCPVYMTPASKEITYQMLLDCQNIQQREVKNNVKRNSKLGPRLEESLSLKKTLSKKRDKESKKYLKEINAYLDFYGVKKDSDIVDVLSKLGEALYSAKDVEGVMGLVKTIDFNKEMKFDSRKKNFGNNNRDDQDYVNILPKKLNELSVYYSHYNEVISKLCEIINKIKNEEIVIGLIKSLGFDNEILFDSKKKELKNNKNVDYDILYQLEKKEKQLNNLKKIVLEIDNSIDLKLKNYDSYYIDIVDKLKDILYSDDRSIFNYIKKNSSTNGEKNEEQFVVTGREKKDIKLRWLRDLIEEVQIIFNNKSFKYKDKNDDFFKELDEAFTFCDIIYPNFLKGEGNGYINKKFKVEYVKKYKKYNKLLIDFHITRKENIDNLYETVRGFIDELCNIDNFNSELYKIDNNVKLREVMSILDTMINIFNLQVSFNINDFKNALGELYISKNSDNDRDDSGFVLTDVAHLVGSASVTFTTIITKELIDGILKNYQDGKSISTFLSGDMGRIHDNRLGRPFIVPKPVDYLQIESTYAGKISFNRDDLILDLLKIINSDNDNNFSIEQLEKLIDGKTKLDNKALTTKLTFLLDNKEIINNEILTKELTKILNVKGHRNREESVKELIDSIKESKGNVLISCFSQQRVQEILLTIMEEAIKGNFILEDQIIVDGKLALEVTNIYLGKFSEKKEVYKLLSIEGQKKAFGNVLFKFLEKDEWELIYSEKGEKVEYEVNKGEEVKIGDEIIERSEYEEKKRNGIWKGRKEKKKYIILASSGMMNGGAIMNHLTKILPDVDATILAPGYLCRGTIGNDIVWGNKESITIGGISYEIKCNKKYIEGFSSHIGHDEILQFISESIEAGRLNKGATIALTHGNIEGQEELKIDIENKLIELDRTDINVRIPGLFETFDILNKVGIDKKVDIKNIISGKQNSNTAYVEKKKIKRPAVPSLLIHSDKEDEKTDKEKISQSTMEEKARNTKNIEDIKKKKDTILKKRGKFKDDYLGNALNNRLASNFHDIFSKIGTLSATQRASFYKSIKLKQNEDRKHESNNKNLVVKIDDIKKLKTKIIDFFNTEKQILIFKINALKLLLENTKSNKVELEGELKELIDNGGKKNEKEKFQNLNRAIKGKQRKIKKIENEIKTLKKNILAVQNGLYRSLKGVFPQKVYIKLDKIYEKMLVEYDSSLETQLNSLCNTIISEYYHEIEVTKKLLISKPTLSFRKSKPSFQGKDYYKELMDSELYDEVAILENEIRKNLEELKDLKPKDKNIELDDTQLEEQERINGNIEDIKSKIRRKKNKYIYKIDKKVDLNLKKLENLINEGTFSKAELEQINKHVSIIKSSNLSKSKKVIAKNNLITYFKEKRNKNRNLGVNASISIGKLNIESLRILSEIFNEEYFESEIKNKFNIYSFLKTKKSLKDYITEKYSLDKLKGIGTKLGKFDEDILQIDGLYDVLDGLGDKTNSSNDVDEIKSVNGEIEEVRCKIEELLK